MISVSPVSKAVSKNVYSDGVVREILIGGYKKRGKRECWESIKMQGVQDFDFLEETDFRY